MEEIWRNYNDIYEISNFGNIRVKKTMKVVYSYKSISV